MADLPTGTTPQRRGFSYPRTLSHTKPHSELLEEYHAGLTTTSPSVDESPIASVSNVLVTVLEALILFKVESGSPQSISQLSFDEESLEVCVIVVVLSYCTSLLQSVITHMSDSSVEASSFIKCQKENISQPPVRKQRVRDKKSRPLQSTNKRRGN